VRLIEAGRSDASNRSALRGIVSGVRGDAVDRIGGTRELSLVDLVGGLNASGPCSDVAYLEGHGIIDGVLNAQIPLLGHRHAPVGVDGVDGESGSGSPRNEIRENMIARRVEGHLQGSQAVQRANVGLSGEKGRINDELEGIVDWRMREIDAIAAA